jgi:hypothetical protein
MSRIVTRSFLISIALALAVLAPWPHFVLCQESNPWGGLQFLVGSWTGAGSGQPGQSGSGASDFAFDLDGKVLVRTNRTEYPPKPGEKAGVVHKDLLIIYPQPGASKLSAIYFDNEGHVINYSVALPAKQPAVVFESEASEKAPRYRLAYELAKDGTLSVEFFVAPPGGEFKSYVKGTLKRKV